MPRCGNRKTQSPGSVGAGGRAGRSVGRSWCPPRSGGNPLTRTGLKQGRRFLLDPVRCFPSGTPGSSHFRPHHVRCSYPTARRASPRHAAQPKAHSRQASLPCNPPSGNGRFQLLIDTPPHPRTPTPPWLHPFPTTAANRRVQNEPSVREPRVRPLANVPPS